VLHPQVCNQDQIHLEDAEETKRILKEEEGVHKDTVI